MKEKVLYVIPKDISEDEKKTAELMIKRIKLCGKLFGTTEVKSVRPNLRGVEIKSKTGSLNENRINF